MEHIQLHPQLDGQENVVEFDFLGKDSIRYYNKVSVEEPVSGAGMEAGNVYQSQISIQNPVPRCALTLENGRNFGREVPRLFYPMNCEGEVPPLAGAPSVGSWVSGLEMAPFILNNFPLPMRKMIFMVFVEKLECLRWERLGGEHPVAP